MDKVVTYSLVVKTHDWKITIVPISGSQLHEFNISSN